MPFMNSHNQTVTRPTGAGCFPKVTIEAGLKLVENGLARLRDDDASGRLPLLHLPRASDDLGAVRDAAARLRAAATDVVFLGTGGASPRGETLAQLPGFSGAGGGPFPRQPPGALLAKPHSPPLHPVV